MFTDRFEPPGIFQKIAAGHGCARNWYEELKKRGENSGHAVDFSRWLSDGEPAPPMEYQCAVAWHNIMVDERFSSESKERAFADFIDRVLNPDNGISTASDAGLLQFLRSADTPDRRKYRDEYFEDLIAAGERPGESPKDEGWDRLASLVKYRRTSENAGLDPDVDGRAYLEWVLGHPDAPANPRAPALVWLTRYRDLEDCIHSEDGEECLSKVGLECSEFEFDTPRPLYFIVVRGEAVWSDLRIPTIADSEFYYMWRATRKSDGPAGMTMHTTKGNGSGVPELVAPRKRLIELLDSGDVQLEAKGLSCGNLRISREHAEDRWHREIGPDMHAAG